MKRLRNGLGFHRWIKPGRERGTAPSMGQIPRLVKNAEAESKVSFTQHVPKIIVAIIVLALGSWIGVRVWLDHQLQTELDAAQSGLNNYHDPSIRQPVEVPEVAVLEEKVRQLISARTPADLDLVARKSPLAPETILSRLAELEKNDGPVRSIKYLRPVESRCLQIETVLVTFQSGGNRIAILSPNSSEEWRVDFDAYARSASQPWTEILSGNPLEATVRIYVAVDRYYNGRYTEDDWVCYAMASPDTKVISFGYVPRASPLDMAIASCLRLNLQNSTLPIQRMTFEIKHTGTGEEKQFEITNVLSDDWAVGDRRLDELDPILMAN